jgi:hypothetical protein
MSLLDECKAAAPAWMAAEGWVSVSRARCEWESGDGAASLAVFNADGMVRVIGWVGDLCMADVRADRKRTGSALSYVAGEVRAEMVARRIASDLLPERNGRCRYCDGGSAVRGGWHREGCPGAPKPEATP